jgi:hypothetical protein
VVNLYDVQQISTTSPTNAAASKVVVRSLMPTQDAFNNSYRFQKFLTGQTTKKAALDQSSPLILPNVLDGG